MAAPATPVPTALHGVINELGIWKSWFLFSGCLPNSNVGIVDSTVNIHVAENSFSW